MSDVEVRFGGVIALSGLTFQVEEGQICALIGPNGAGKTTLFNVVSRLYQPSRGRVGFDGVDLLRVAPHRIAKLGIARTFQNLALVPGLSVMDNVRIGAHASSTGGVVASALRLPVIATERRLEADARSLLDRLDLTHVADRPCVGLPYGTLKRVELARALAARPRLLMLDEPASGLTHSEVDELSALIRRLRDEFDLTIVLVEHHMKMVMGLSDHVVVLEFGTRIAEGPPEQIQADEKVVAAYLGTGA